MCWALIRNSVVEAATSSTSSSCEQSTSMFVSSDSNNKHEETESLSSGSGLCSGASATFSLLSVLVRKRKIASSREVSKSQFYCQEYSSFSTCESGEPLKNKHLFFCWKELSLKSSSLCNHFKSS